MISSAYNVLTSRGVENQAPVEEGGENTGLTTTKRKSPKKPLDKNRRAVQIRNRAAKAYNQLANSGKVVKKKKSSSYENQKAFNQIFTASIGQLMEVCFSLLSFLCFFLLCLEEDEEDRSL